MWHCAVRAAPEDQVLSDAEWEQVAAGIMDRTGLAPAGDDLGVRWVAVRHAPDHVHIVATLARQDGTRPRIWNDFYRVREACLEAEERLGLAATAPTDRTAGRRPSRAETEQAARRGWREAPRVTLRREVASAAAGARTEQEFFARLADVGVTVRLRHSTTSPGGVTGYAVGLHGHTAKDGGGIIWYGGGKLAADLTLPKLRARWTTGTDDAAGQGMSPTAARAVLRKMVTGAADQAGDEAGFFARLRADSVLVRLRFSEIDPGQVTGYAVGLPGHAGADGETLWYGGGRLAERLTLPRPRRRWNTGQPGTPGRSGAFRFTAPERDALYAHAARQGEIAAEHIRRCAAGDPWHGADAAWATAGTLHAAARAPGSREPRRAADAYGRAARAGYGRIPQRTSEGSQLRAVARLMAVTGSLTSGATFATAALVANLVALAMAVAELREAQRHAAQASAARAAAAHLRTAPGQGRPPGPQPGRAQTRGPGQAADRRPGQPATAPGLTRADFPAPAQPGRPVPAGPGASRPRPRGGPVPPRRAGPGRRRPRRVGRGRRPGSADAGAAPGHGLDEALIARQAAGRRPVRRP